MDRRGAVLLAGGKGDDVALAGQRRLAAAKVGNQPVDRLVAVIGVLLQQLQDDGRQHPRHVRAYRVRGQRRRGDVVMRPVGLVVLSQLKRQAAGQEFIQHHAEAVEIAAVIHGTLGAGGVFRRHPRRRTARNGKPGLGESIGERAGEAKAAQAAGGIVLNKNAAGLDIAVDQVLQMHLAQRDADLDRQLDKARDPRDRPARAPRQQLKGKRGVHQREASPVLGGGDGANGPAVLQHIAQRKLVFEKPGSPLFLFVAHRGGDNERAAGMRMSRVHPGDSALLRQHGKNHILFKDKNPPLVKIPLGGPECRLLVFVHPRSLLSAGQLPLDMIQQNIDVNGLTQKSSGAQTESVPLHIFISMTGDKEHGRRRYGQQPQLVKQLKAAHAPQLDIGDHQRRAGQGERMAQKYLCRIKRIGRIAFRLQEITQPAADGTFVINDGNAPRQRHAVIPLTSHLTSRVSFAGAGGAGPLIFGTQS